MLNSCPISFSSDNLHKYLEDDTSLPSSSATGLGIDENGKVAMPMLSVPGSQPRTPLASSTPRLNTLVTGAQSAPGIHQRSYSLNGSILGSLNSSTGLGGHGGGVREADDTIRDLRKENFNLIRGSDQRVRFWINCDPLWECRRDNRFSFVLVCTNILSKKLPI